MFFGTAEYFHGLISAHYFPANSQLIVISVSAPVIIMKANIPVLLKILMKILISE